jgi:hypothetical protein
VDQREAPVQRAGDALAGQGGEESLLVACDGFVELLVGQLPVLLRELRVALDRLAETSDRIVLRDHRIDRQRDHRQQQQPVDVAAPRALLLAELRLGRGDDRSRPRRLEVLHGLPRRRRRGRGSGARGLDVQFDRVRLRLR